MDQLQSVTSNALVTILMSILSLASAYAIYYMTKLKAKVVKETDKIEDELARNYANSILDKVEEALSLAVDKMESTLVQELKKASEDGKLTKEDQVVVAEAAKNKANEILGDDMNNLLQGIVGDTSKYVDAKISSLVIEKKNEVNLISSSDNSDDQLDKILND